MDTAYNEKVKNRTVDIMINKAMDIAKKAGLGFSSTGCQEEQLGAAVLCYHCMQNDVLFNETQLNNINNVLNSI